jgi:EAL domain-containing protein (putative c-di-GMP-specific phosphodiesterase class I)
VNVSARDLSDQELPARIESMLREHALPAAALEIELTETVLQTGPITLDAVRQLRAKGVAIALDDFGTGYSTLASLEQLPLSRVKLDRSLIAGVDCSPRSIAIARAIIALCRDLGLEITAEGVERPAQVAFLRDYSLHLQGYLLSRPVPENLLLETLHVMPGRLEEALLAAVATGSGDLPSPIRMASAAAHQ